jgi:hypothetical protein
MRFLVTETGPRANTRSLLAALHHVCPVSRGGRTRASKGLCWCRPRRCRRSRARASTRYYGVHPSNPTTSTRLDSAGRGAPPRFVLLQRQRIRRDSGRSAGIDWVVVVEEDQLQRIRRDPGRRSNLECAHPLSPPPRPSTLLLAVHAEECSRGGRQGRVGEFGGDCRPKIDGGALERSWVAAAVHHGQE